MKHKEYIIPIGEEAKEFDEIFIGVIRKQPELIRCKDCKHRDWDVVDIPYGLTKHIEWCSIRFNAEGENIEVSPNDFCSKAERKEE